MASEAELSGLTDLLHSSTRMLEQAAPSNQFPPLQRNLDQLEALSRKLKSKTLRSEAPSKSITATRLLAREGMNAEQLARDLKSFDLKSTYEDVFPSEATTVEEFLQQVHEMAMVSAIQEAQKDNLRSYSNYMMQVLQDDWQNEKRDFLQSLNKLATLPRQNVLPRTVSTSVVQIASPGSGIYASSASSAAETALLSNKTIIEKKASVYAVVVKSLNEARGRGLPFKPAAAFRDAYESLGLDTSATKTVTMKKIWHLVQTLAGEDLVSPANRSNKMSLVMGARRHLEWGHEKYIFDTIHSNPAQAALGGAVSNLSKIRAFLRVRLRDHGILDFDAGDARRHPPVDTTWQQIYYCLRTGYYEEARHVAQSSRVASLFVSQLSEWITNGGSVLPETAAAASEECDKMLRMADRMGRAGYDRKKLLLYAIVSGRRRQIERLIGDMPSLFNTIEDFLWFILSSIHDCSSGPASHVLSEGSVPYSIDDLQCYLSKFEPSHYTKKGKDPLLYPYVLLLSIQLLPAIVYLSKESSVEGYSVDSVHIAVVFTDHGVISEGGVLGQNTGLGDACAEAASIIRQYGSAYLCHGNLHLTLEYYVQAASALGGGETSWLGRSNSDQQRQRDVMLKHLLMDILLRDGGVYLLLGPSGAGEEGEIKKYLVDWKSQQQFLLEAANQCQVSGLYEKSVEIYRRIGAFALALETINKCLSNAICAMKRGRLDGESQTAGLVNSGNEVLEASKYSSEASFQEKEHLSEQQIVLWQLEAILYVHKLAGAGKHVEALREIVKLPFLPLNIRASDVTDNVFENLSPHVQSCVPDLLKVALICLDHVKDSDGTLRALKSKIASFVANNMTRNWPHDLYEKVARIL